MRENSIQVTVQITLEANTLGMEYARSRGWNKRHAGEGDGHLAVLVLLPQQTFMQKEDLRPLSHYVLFSFSSEVFFFSVGCIEKLPLIYIHY